MSVGQHILEMHLTLVFSLLVAVATALPYEPINLPNPSDLALVLSEDEFEDYLDAWLEIEEQKWVNANASTTETKDTRNGCTLNVNGDLGQPQPVYLRNNNYLVASGTSGQIKLNTGDTVYIACTGSGRKIVHPNVNANVATGTAKCVSNAVISGSGWMNGNGAFGQLTCSSHSYHDEQLTSEKCYNNNAVVRIGFIVDGTFYPLLHSCFDQKRLEVLYVWYEQNPENTVHQSNVDRPSWFAGNQFPGININNLYTQNQQKISLTNLVGSDLANKYVTNSQYLARGHLAAKSDFVFATGQRATFYFTNAAPQWQPFNGGNWNLLEQNLRKRIGAAGYRTTVYTGTFGVTQLRDKNNKLVDWYLHQDNNNNPQLPVPLYFYKVVYDSSRKLGTAFVSINNPYYTEAEVKSLTFCTDRCRGNSAFNWIGWSPDRIDIGYSFCCDVNEFRKKIPHLPSFTVNGLLS